MEKTTNLKESFVKGFDPVHYSKVYVKRKRYQFFIRNLHAVFEEGQVRGRSCLEVGAGPTVHNIASVSKYCDVIVTSDFLASNRNQIKLWLKNDPEAIDWTRQFSDIAQLEGFSDLDVGSKEIQARIRSKIQDVLYCDITQASPLEKAVDSFDVLITSACLESATQTPSEVKSAVKNVVSLVKSGGKILILGFLNCSFYIINDVKFTTAQLTEELIAMALKESGCTVQVFKEELIDDEASDATGCFFCLATKL